MTALLLWRRVYLIGGADAKASHDAVPVYTPSFFIGPQLWAYNVTLPHGFFSSTAKNAQQG